jgi:predicted Zn finger-like uncharacterized protein
MNVSCPECGSLFRVDPAKVPEGGVRARCSICGGIIPLSREAGAQPPSRPSADVAGGYGEGAAASGGERGESFDRGSSSFGDDRYAPTAVEAAPEPARSEPPFDGAASGGSAPQQGAQPTPAGGRRPINPFLNNDPGMKAKRLARALVSDMITYQPQKREEGLRNNTLKQLFRDEIKKSYEEYVDQVGRDVAESTAHFQDALNDILANGRKVF